MTVIFEFLGNEPIENVITCMHFKVDKVVFFGYHETIQNQKDKAENFLKEYCGVQKVVFHPLSHYDLQAVLQTMKKEIEYELGIGADIFFDITGGESLILVAFGMLSKEFDTPMHLYDIPTDKLIELDDGATSSISKSILVNNLKMDLDKYIEMKGGRINYNLHKTAKDCSSEEFVKDISAILKVSMQFDVYWNLFSEFIRNHMAPDGNLQVNKSSHDIIHAVKLSKNKLNTIGELNQILDALAEEGILEGLVHENGKYGFKYKNQQIKDCLWEGGSALELDIYHREKGTSDDCRVGVHIDWDGVVHNEPGRDVLNEIDVLSLRGLVPTFISCKSGKMTAQQILHALYELDTVAKRFGGKYAQKVLVTVQGVSEVYHERAKEMDIELRVLMDEQ